MRIPYVIDNIEYRLGDVLNYLLRREQGQQVDVATAYFSIRGFANFGTRCPVCGVSACYWEINRSKVKISGCA